jgi:hypothetical protein
MAMADMTLEQVRDRISDKGGDGGFHCNRFDQELLIDAIDSAIKAQDEPVATVRRSESGSYWIDWHGKQLPDYLGCNLYTAPPTDDRPTWEEVRRLLARAWSECRYRSDHHETHNSYNEADRIIAEFRKK